MVVISSTEFTYDQRNHRAYMANVANNLKKKKKKL